MIFSSESLVFESNLLDTERREQFARRSRPLFCHERPERIAQGGSFVKSKESNSLIDYSPSF